MSPPTSAPAGRYIIGNTYHLLRRRRRMRGPRLHAFMAGSARSYDSGGYRDEPVELTKVTSRRAFKSHSKASGSEESRTVVRSSRARLRHNHGARQLIPPAERDARPTPWSARCAGPKVARDFAKEKAAPRNARRVRIQQGGVRGIARRFRRSADRIGFEGYAVGGLAVGEGSGDVSVPRSRRGSSRRPAAT